MIFHIYVLANIIFVFQGVAGGMSDGVLDLKMPP